MLIQTTAICKAQIGDLDLELPHSPTMLQPPTSVVECDVIIRHQCDVCCKLFDTELELCDHLWRVHISEKDTHGNFPTGRIPETDIPMDDVIPPCRSQQAKHLMPQGGPKPYKCTVCTYSCRTKQAIIKHFRCHTGEKPCSCEVCHYSARDLSTLCDHVRNRHPSFKPLKYSACAEAFLVPTHLRRHLRSHMGQQQNVRLQQCAMCDYETGYTSALYRHIGRKHPARHPDAGPFKCTVCGQSFVTKMI